MMSRLVLVGMVAALGITVPTWPEIHARIQSVHHWTAARLADLDAGSSRYEDPPMAAVTPVHRRRASDPIAPDTQISKVADDLNRRSDGLDLPAEIRFVRRRPAPAAGESSKRSHQCRETAIIPTVDLAQCAEIQELLEIARRQAAGDGAIDPSSVTRSSRPKVSPVACVFRASTGENAGARVASAVVGSERTGASKMRIEPISPWDPGPADVATSLNRFAEGIDLPPSSTMDARAAKPRFTTIDPAISARPSLGDELNRAADGLSVASSLAIPDKVRQPPSARDRHTPPSMSPSERPASNGTAAEVAQAVRLTRDALQAWMKVVAGPPTVQVSAR